MILAQISEYLNAIKIAGNQNGLTDNWLGRIGLYENTNLGKLKPLGIKFNLIKLDDDSTIILVEFSEKNEVDMLYLSQCLVKVKNYGNFLGMTDSQIAKLNVCTPGEDKRIYQTEFNFELVKIDNSPLGYGVLTNFFTDKGILINRF